MKRKPRILWCGEASFLNTGYAVYAKEVLTRLFQTNKYEIAELACYGSVDDEELQSVPWRYYGNLPNLDNQQELDNYQSSQIYQFGEWRFEDVCMDFKPDIVCDIRDWWMLEYQQRSPFRDFYHWMIMPTIDSAPQQEEWLATYLDADTVFTYSEYGKGVLEKEIGEKITVKDICSPGANLDKFFPVPNKSLHRETSGFQQDITVIGTVMRNQKRKLYPELISAFASYLKKHPTESKKVFLYLHTTYPDNGWDIPRLIREAGVASRVLLTYKCKRCGFVFPSFFQEATTTCAKCGKIAASPPTPQSGVSTEDLCKIINFFDLYVQYSICEGFGMPQVEAACCGVPVMAVDYSAMSSVIRNIKGYPIDVKVLFRELETHSMRAYPDNDDLVSKLHEFVSLPQPMKAAKGREAYNAATKRYSWDETAKKWETALDEVKLRDTSETWDSQPRLINPPQAIPNPISNEDLISWGIINLWGNQRMIDSFTSLRLLRELNQGFIMYNFKNIFNLDESLITQKSWQEFGQQDVIDQLHELGQINNHWELQRVGSHRNIPEFIQNKKLGINE